MATTGLYYNSLQMACSDLHIVIYHTQKVLALVVTKRACRHAARLGRVYGEAYPTSCPAAALRRPGMTAEPGVAGVSALTRKDTARRQEKVLAMCRLWRSHKTKISGGAWPPGSTSGHVTAGHMAPSAEMQAHQTL